MAENNARYPEIFDEYPYNSLEDEDILLAYRPSTGILGGIKAKDFGVGDTASSIWSSTFTYNTDDLVVYDNKWWKSLVDNNTGNIPQEDTNWTEVSKGINFGLWTVGVYTEQEVFVRWNLFGNGNYGAGLYRLSNPTRPYNSTNLFNEWVAGDWELMTTSYFHGEAAGVVNAYTLSLNAPQLDQYLNGLRIVVDIPIANTGPSTIDVNGLGVKNIVRRDGTALQAGDMPVDSLNLLVYHGNQFQLLTYDPNRPSIRAIYADTTGLIADQSNQSSGFIYEVTDASGDATVDSGKAWYRYKGTTVGDLTDYEKISEAEAFSENAGGGSGDTNKLEGAVNKNTATNFTFGAQGQYTIDATQTNAFNYEADGTNAISAVTFSVRTGFATTWETITFANLVNFIAGSYTTPGQSYSVGASTNWEVRFEASFGASAPSKDFKIQMNLTP